MANKLQTRERAIIAYFKNFAEFACAYNSILNFIKNEIIRIRGMTLKAASSHLNHIQAHLRSIHLRIPAWAVHSTLVHQRSRIPRRPRSRVEFLVKPRARLHNFN